MKEPELEAPRGWFVLLAALALHGPCPQCPRSTKVLCRLSTNTLPLIPVGCKPVLCLGVHLLHAQSCKVLAPAPSQAGAEYLMGGSVQAPICPSPLLSTHLFPTLLCVPASPALVQSPGSGEGFFWLYPEGFFTAFSFPKHSSHTSPPFSALKW